MPSLTDFVESLPDELLLCPVHALLIFLSRTSSLSPRPRSLFVSPRCPRSLSKNALSYFLRSVIIQSLPLAPPFSVPPSASSSRSGSSASPAPSSAPSSFRAHSVRAMATLTAFAHIVPVSTLLEAATWQSASVFTTFYFRDVQFESTWGFSLGPMVAAGAVV